jgi:hypothetical protein
MELQIFWRFNLAEVVNEWNQSTTTTTPTIPFHHPLCFNLALYLTYQDEADVFQFKYIYYDALVAARGVVFRF